jgi:hypothetical protein
VKVKQLETVSYTKVIMLRNARIEIQCFSTRKSKCLPKVHDAPAKCPINAALMQHTFFSLSFESLHI